MRRESWEFRQKGYSIHIKNIPNGCIVNIFLFLYAACLQKKNLFIPLTVNLYLPYTKKNFFIPLVTLKKNRKTSMKGCKKLLDIYENWIFKTLKLIYQKLYTLKLCEAENILDNKFLSLCRYQKEKLFF